MKTNANVRVLLAAAAATILIGGGAEGQQAGTAATMKTVPESAMAHSAAPAESALSLWEAEAKARATTARTFRSGNSAIHVFSPPSAYPKGAAAAAPTPLLYHAGGPVMLTTNIYAIFWVPKTLQDGTSTSMSATYKTVQARMLADYPGHGIDNNNTQYYQNLHGTPEYIENAGAFGGQYTDETPYPKAGCKDTKTPGGCLTDAQIQAEVIKITQLKKWPAGLGNIYFVFTSKGEGSCFDATSTACAYTSYCAYHGFVPNSGQPIIYANMPFGDPSVCQTAGTPSPNGDPEADTTTTAASHELTEAITDPQLNAWFTASGEEIGDLCAYQYSPNVPHNYPTNTWDGGKANQMWNGHFYELQLEYDNHSGGCVEVGP